MRVRSLFVPHDGGVDTHLFTWLPGILDTLGAERVQNLPLAVREGDASDAQHAAVAGSAAGAVRFHSGRFLTAQPVPAHHVSRVPNHRR